MTGLVEWPVFRQLGFVTRLDQALVEHGLCDSRERAKRLVLARQVRINGQSAHKPSDRVKPGDKLTLDTPEKFVSRGGYKLEHALEHFQLAVNGLIAIDLGASTGGFTDCLLQRGAEKVFAVDVGQGQLAWKLRRDPRVVVMEKTNARFLKPENFPAPADLVVVDCSFISLKKILPPAVPLLKPDGKMVALIKPQFEAGKAEADKGRGVITDATVHDRVLAELQEFVASQAGPVRYGGGSLEASREALSHGAGLCWRGVVQSPLLGPAGNKEFLALIEKKR